MGSFQVKSWGLWGLVISFFALFYGVSGLPQWGEQRKPASFSRIPQEQNERAINSCLSKLKGFVSTQETTSLDNLKTRVERVYGLKRSIMNYRELYYKTQSGEKWRAEFYLTPESVWGKEKYKLKFFRANESGTYVQAPSPIKEELLDKEATLKWGQAEDVETDERWERFSLPTTPVVNYKSKNFKLFEFTVVTETPPSSLLCNIAGGHPFCQCTTESAPWARRKNFR